MIYQYNKLVRDKIPNEINSVDGRKATWRTMEKDEYLRELNRKIIEEAHEFSEDDSVEELADVMEVIENIMREKNITWEEVKEKKEEKRNKKGGFLDRIYLECVEEEKG